MTRSSEVKVNFRDVRIGVGAKWSLDVVEASSALIDSAIGSLGGVWFEETLLGGRIYEFVVTSVQSGDGLFELASISGYYQPKRAPEVVEGA